MSDSLSSDDVARLRQAARAACDEIDRLRDLVDGLTAEIDGLNVTQVTPADIVAQRLKGWTDFHPETYCHRCGQRNIASWSVDSATWNATIQTWDEAPTSEILCPQCFTERHEELNSRTTWVLTVDGLVDGLTAARDTARQDADALSTFAWHRPGCSRLACDDDRCDCEYAEVRATYAAHRVALAGRGVVTQDTLE